MLKSDHHSYWVSQEDDKWKGALRWCVGVCLSRAQGYWNEMFLFLFHESIFSIVNAPGATAAVHLIFIPVEVKKSPWSYNSPVASIECQHLLNKVNPASSSLLNEHNNLFSCKMNKLTYVMCESPPTMMHNSARWVTQKYLIISSILHARSTFSNNRSIPHAEMKCLQTLQLHARVF
jgi:hypothetical protein